MTINRIDQMEPIQPGRRAERNNPVAGVDRADSINLSAEARQRAEMHQIMEFVRAAPELSDIQIAEIRQKINDPAYVNERVLSITAARIMGSGFLG